jgi:hypothetical protein
LLSGSRETLRMQPLLELTVRRDALCVLIFDVAEERPE